MKFLNFSIRLLFVCFAPAIWATEPSPSNDPNCAAALQAPQEWVKQRFVEIVQVNSRLNELSRTTPSNEADQTIAIYGEETDTTVRIMGKSETSRMYSGASVHQLEPIVKASRRALELRVKSPGAFEGLVYLLTENAHATLAAYMQKLSVGRITAVLATSAGTGKINIELYDKSSDGRYTLIVGGQQRGHLMQDPKYARELLIAYALNSENLEEAAFNYSDRRIDFVNRMFSTDLPALDVARYGTATQLAKDILYYLGLRFNPFNTETTYFVQKSADDGAEWPRERTRIARKIGSALTVLLRERFVYVNPNAQVESRRDLPAGWITTHAYSRAWESKGFDGFLRKPRRGTIDGMDVSLASAEAIQKVESLGFHWNESAQKFVR